MSGDRQDRARWRGVKDLGIAGWIAHCVDDAAFGNLHALVESDTQLAFGDRTARHVQEHGRTACDRYAGSDRIGREPAFGAAKRRDQDAHAAGIHEVQRDKPGFGGHQRPIANPTEVARIAQRDNRHAVLCALVDAVLRGLDTDRLAEAVLAVDDGDYFVFEIDANRLIRLHLAVLEPGNVGGHTDHAVRVVSDKVCLGEIVTDAGGFVAVAAGGGENVCGEGLQLGAR